MNKLKRIKLLIMSKTLRLIRFISNEKYRDWSYKYYKECGVDFCGKPKYINYDVDFDLTKPNMIHIGNNTVVAKKCVFLTHDFSIECGLIAIKKTKDDYEMQFLKDVYVGDNCFIGACSFILPGTRIGNGCIIGAGSVVTGNVPDNCIYAGNPAKFISKTDEWAERKLKEDALVAGTKKK